MIGLFNTSYRPLFLSLILIIVSGTTISNAQDMVTELNEIEITANKIEKYGIGSTITKIDTTILKNHSQSSLSTLLSSQSSIFIKQYGSGMLSTVSFRGTGAGHTAVRWNGLQVGYPFLGQADLSLIPIDFIQEVTLQHGSSSARYGTGAIGGMIDLQSGKPTKGFNLTINQSLASFYTSNSSLQIANSGSKGYIRLSGINKQSKNNFPYKSSNGIYIGEQINSGYLINGGQLESKYILNNKSSFQLIAQSIYADRNIQPPISSTANNNQKDKNLWSSLVFTQLLKTGVINVQYGYLFDRINYNGSVTDSKQNIARATIENDIINNLSTETGIQSTWIEVATPFYENRKTHEIRTNLYTAISWALSNRIKTSINLRQAFVTGYKVPFTPSLGLEFKAVKTNSLNLELIGQLAKGYKVPTLNDRFWMPGGNLNLNPEESINAEWGIKFRKVSNSIFWIHASNYQLWVENWILWLPQGTIWSPINKRKVKGFGIELESGLEQSYGKYKLKGWLNYAFTKSTNKEALDSYDRSVGMQLPYTPFHNGNISGQASLKRWSILLNATATGKRFITSDNETQVPGYILLNTRIAYNFPFHSWQVSSYLEGNNLTNTNYQTIINRAMPGINFLAGLKINFNKQKK